MVGSLVNQRLYMKTNLGTGRIKHPTNRTQRTPKRQRVGNYKVNIGEQ
jgi:hypothetical protein